MKITDCQPDLGNPTVRDERGAYGNVSYGGTRNPLHTPKGCRTETLCLRLRAPYFYPTICSVCLAYRPRGMYRLFSIFLRMPRNPTRLMLNWRTWRVSSVRWSRPTAR